jgi:hypothetical protein
VSGNCPFEQLRGLRYRHAIRVRAGIQVSAGYRAVADIKAAVALRYRFLDMMAIAVAALNLGHALNPQIRARIAREVRTQCFDKRMLELHQEGA